MDIQDVQTMCVLRREFTKWLNDNDIFSETINDFIVFLLSKHLIDDNKITTIIIGGDIHA